MLLPVSLEKMWASYVAEETHGVRSIALGLLEAFIERLADYPASVWHEWGLELARQAAKPDSRIVVRMPLFRHVLFPALRLELEKGSGWAARALAAQAQLMHHCKECRDQLPDNLHSEYGLILEAVRRDPNDKASRRRLLEIYRDRFDYALHELPTGVLYGANGATPDECTKMLSELNDYQLLCSELGNGEKDAELIADARFHITVYKEYLLSGDYQDGYAVFLAQRDSLVDSQNAGS